MSCHRGGEWRRKFKIQQMGFAGKPFDEKMGETTMNGTGIHRGMSAIALVAVFMFSFAPVSVSTVKAGQDILFTLLQEQSPDTYWAGKENMVYAPWTYPAGPLGYDDISVDWWGMNKDSMGTGHRFISEMGLDSTFSTHTCSSEKYHFFC